jgi:hypothetical protein
VGYPVELIDRFIGWGTGYREGSSRPYNGNCDHERNEEKEEDGDIRKQLLN